MPDHNHTFCTVDWCMAWCRGSPGLSEGLVCIGLWSERSCHVNAVCTTAAKVSWRAVQSSQPQTTAFNAAVVGLYCIAQGVTPIQPPQAVHNELD